jgi:hypothetical protein
MEEDGTVSEVAMMEAALISAAKVRSFSLTEQEYETTG